MRRNMVHANQHFQPDLFELSPFAPRNAPQQEALRAWDKHDLLFLLGGAGSGKTHCALRLALGELQTRKKKKLLVIRPPVECGPSIGYLPGELLEKVAPWARAVEDLLCKMVHKGKPPSGMFEFCVPNHCRGLTWDDAVVVIDEAQNCQLSQLKMLLTRMGSNCKVVVCGDTAQSDVQPSYIPAGDGYLCDLDYAVDRMEGLPGVHVSEFGDEDCLRHPVVRLVLRHL